MKAKIVHTEFAAQIRRAGITQAAFAQLCGVTTTAVSYWCTGRRQVPQWARALCAALEVLEPDELLAPPELEWFEILGVDPDCSMREVTTARNQLVKRYHPDVGGSDDAMARINAAFDLAKGTRAG